MESLHIERYLDIKNKNWYDPNTRDEVFICNLLKIYSQDTSTINFMINEILITNNVFLCVHNINNEDVLKIIKNRLSESRYEELLNLLK
mgnify:CR=1 FL=1